MTTDIKYLTMALSDETLLSLNDDLLEMVGRQISDRLKRRRDELLCDREGHVSEVFVCPRCARVPA